MASPPSCYLYRDTQHPRTPRARARMLHSAGLNVPRLYSNPRLLFFFPRVRSVPPRSRTRRFLVPFPFFSFAADGNNASNGTQPGETGAVIASIESFLLSLSFSRTLYPWRWKKVKLITHRYNFDFWNYYYPWTSVSINRGDQESSGSFTVINKRFRMRNVSKKVISLLLARVSYFYARD